MTKRKDTPEVAPEEGANIAAADALMGIFGMIRQETYYALCDAVWAMKLAESQDEAKRLCIQGEITVNGKTERDPWRSVCRFDEVAKLRPQRG
ncbi:MAG: S4 domain-containing protein [Candidatus Neomarinimicrobiota bacterium]